VHFGYVRLCFVAVQKLTAVQLKSEDLASKAGKALLKKRATLDKAANFRCVVLSPRLSDPSWGLAKRPPPQKKDPLHWPAHFCRIQEQGRQRSGDGLNPVRAVRVFF